MEAQELLDIVQKGESSTVQFKERMPHGDSLAYEMIAFSNSQGGIIIFGVNDKTGGLAGLSFAEIQELNRQIVNIASQKIYPSIVLTTGTVRVEGNNVVIVEVAEGINKPYKDNNGIIYIKNGSDKRKVTSNEELSRLLQSGGSLYADEQLVGGSSIDDIDMNCFNAFLEKKYGVPLQDLKLPLETILKNLRLGEGNLWTLAGLLSFSTMRQRSRPQFSIQCIKIDGVAVGNAFSDVEPPFDGHLFDVFYRTVDFINRNMRKIPDGDGFNAPFKWEISRGVFEELLVNALVHRDYFIASTIKVFIFLDRIEITSPGKLPNSITIANIRNGISVMRNPVLLSVARHILPYRGLGTGIARAYSLYPDIELENQIEENQFRVIIKRR
jgi:predicted HTH transcriptional regulator